MRFLITAIAALGLLHGPATMVQAQETLGDFYLFERTDPDSGEDRTSITTLADESYVSGAGGLTFRCSEEGFELVLTATYLGRKASTPVGYVFGDEEPAAASWTLRSTGMAAIAPDDVREAFTSRAVEESSVAIHVSDFQMRDHTYTFHLNGLDSALARLSCR
jgi:hypothetical protein